jgi:organic radical activating enzyme
MNQIANITEIFSSIQGEGPYTGTNMTFVRFAGCNINCRWCDTDTTLNSEMTYRIETPPQSGKFITHKNPVTAESLNNHLLYFTDNYIAVTGGEPLLQSVFLIEWLGSANFGKKILLETNGICFDELKAISRYIDIISMDIKLPSSTGGRSFWNEHSKFINSALHSGKEFYIKIVVTPDTSNKDLQDAITMISSANKFIPVVIQPVSETTKYRETISKAQIESFARLCGMWLPNVKIMGQLHKEKGLL